MDAAGEALKAEIAQLDEDVAADNEAVVAGGTAIVVAGEKFAELKTQIEGLSAGQPLTDEEIEQLTAAAGEVDTHVGEATTSLTSHVQQLGEETSAA